jgi:hypothetical protein
MKITTMWYCTCEGFHKASLIDGRALAEAVIADVGDPYSKLNEADLSGIVDEVDRVLTAFIVRMQLFHEALLFFVARAGCPNKGGHYHCRIRSRYIWITTSSTSLVQHRPSDQVKSDR